MPRYFSHQRTSHLADWRPNPHTQVSKAEFLTSSSDQGRLTGDRELCIKSARTDHIGCVSPGVLGHLYRDLLSDLTVCILCVRITCLPYHPLIYKKKTTLCVRVYRSPVGILHSKLEISTIHRAGIVRLLYENIVLNPISRSMTRFIYIQINANWNRNLPEDNLMTITITSI
ncbi:hypothetical protein FOZ60_014350 [Perkinsus olseni]|uniref:Uncharacterized protein n=1 Tax=Perkinsus olseni TaxID=32597 RepID=A0A7J6P7E8_PEROL|nr:hypothetical protein FOZ60_014350 [Perkinsus olseni]